MPRETLEPERKIEYLSILDEDAKLDDALEPQIDDDTLLALHRAMVRARRFDERLLRLQRQGRIGTFAPVHGQEAAQIGAVACLKDDDWLVPAFRETAAQLWRGIPMEGILLFNAGYNEGGAIPDDQYTLPIAIPVASQLPHAVGLAGAMKARGEDRIAMTFFGDGATSEGDFHEAMNFAGVFHVPCVFVCQNNGWAISIPRSRQTRAKTLAQKALAYDVPALQVDGNDVLAVWTAAREAVERAREGGGPTMIECLTYRMSVHTTADDPTKYRREEEVEKWAKRDPIDRFRRYLADKGLLDDDGVAALEEEIGEEVDGAWESAKAQIGKLEGPRIMFDHVFAELPPTMAESRAIFDAAAGPKGNEADLSEDGTQDDDSGEDDAGDDDTGDEGAESGERSRGGPEEHEGDESGNGDEADDGAGDGARKGG